MHIVWHCLVIRNFFLLVCIHCCSSFQCSNCFANALYISSLPCSMTSKAQFFTGEDRRHIHWWTNSPEEMRQLLGIQALDLAGGPSEWVEVTWTGPSGFAHIYITDKRTPCPTVVRMFNGKWPSRSHPREGNPDGRWL